MQYIIKLTLCCLEHVLGASDKEMKRSKYDDRRKEVDAECATVAAWYTWYMQTIVRDVSHWLPLARVAQVAQVAQAGETECAVGHTTTSTRSARRAQTFAFTPSSSSSSSFSFSYFKALLLL